MDLAQQAKILRESGFIGINQFPIEEERKPLVLKKEAYYGIAGEIVRRIEPHTEACNAALLMNFLTAMGNMVGSTSYFVVESTKHYPKLFAVLVGDSSKGRKGSSWGHIKRILERVDPKWVEDIRSGLSSGEGVIFHLRDPEDEHEKTIQDKRLFIIEEELSSPLKMIERKGNILSEIIRQAWDSGNLYTMTKNPLKATGCHISILGHITNTELLKVLNDKEVANGFANRFLWVYVSRSKILPEGGNFHHENIDDLVNELKEIQKFASITRELKKDNPTKEYWAAIYEKLSSGFPGILGTVTNRAEAQTMRLAALYALLDKSILIRIEHLNAALAVWDYCFESARYIFGSQIGDSVAKKILCELRKRQSLSTTDIHGYFKSNEKVNGEKIHIALEYLKSHGFIFENEIKTDGKTRRMFSAI